MITERDLDEAIAECQGKRNPTATDCIKLSAFLQLKERMFPEKAEQISMPTQSYSYSAGNDYVQYSSESEFGKLVNSKEIDQILPFLDDLVETVKVVNPRLYNAFMAKIKAL